MRLLVFAALILLNLLLAEFNYPLAIAGGTILTLAIWLFRRRLELSVARALFLGILVFASAMRTRLPSPELTLPEGFGWLREHVRALCQGVSQDAQALVLGITSGDDSALSRQLFEQMRDLSLTHLTAVSGTNCSILIAATYALLATFGLRTRGRVIGSISVLALYLGLVGNQPSVYRAAAMASFALLAMLSSSRLDPVATLGASVIAILMIDPRLASNYGFALSACATAGLLILAPRVFEKLKTKLPNWLALSLSVTVSAQLFCLPVLAVLQPEQSSLAIVANLLVEPVVAIITLLGISATVLSLLSPPLAGALFWLASWPAQYIVATVKFLSKVDAPTIEMSNLAGLAVLAILLIVIALKVPRFKRLSLLGLAGLSITLLSIQASTVINSRLDLPTWFYVSCDVGQGDATVIRSQNQIAVIDVGREPKLINRCLNRLGVKTIDLLVLTHFDADHVAGLEGAIEGRKVKLALVTDYKDDRPGANWIQFSLSAHGIHYESVEKGDRGNLGEFSWLVLSPHHSGRDSEDPNDGSVTMLWQDSRVNVVTLADLGEKGQMRLGEELSSWDNPQLHQNPTVVKVSHHGSADQFPELYEWLKPAIATISDGKGNSYGHPTKATLKLLRESAQITLRTDLLGNIAIAADGDRGLLFASG